MLSGESSFKIGKAFQARVVDRPSRQSGSYSELPNGVDILSQRVIHSP